MPRGGMRWGAGRPGYRLRADHTLSVDVRHWARDGLLKPGRFNWLWRDADSGEEQSSIAVSVECGRLSLHYRAGGHAFTDSVSLHTTPCHYGGTRHWFNCPHCGRRCALLFLRWGRFRCRACQQIAYRSQSEDLMGRAWIRQAKAEAKLGGGWTRPKGMHTRTYDRLLQAVLACEELRDDALFAFMSRRGWIE